jgi:hypothetical protein
MLLAALEAFLLRNCFEAILATLFDVFSFLAIMHLPPIHIVALHRPDPTRGSFMDRNFFLDPSRDGGQRGNTPA